VLIVFVCCLFLRRPARPQAVLRIPHLAVAVAGWLAALLILASGWLVTNAPYLKSKVVLTEQHRWSLAHLLTEVHGLAYLDGKLYIASLGPRDAQGVLQAGAGEVGAFDPATGNYTTIHPIGATGVLTYAYPGDIKTGPEHLLYLLNNGPGDQALYIMQPDGRVTRQVALNGKGALAIGFNIGPDKKLYATDLARMYQWPPEGGTPFASWGGPKGNFNNIAGVTVGPDGTIYGAETSEKRVHVFDGSGQLRQTVDLGCAPWQMVVSGDWLDIACQNGFRSLNRQSNDLRLGRVGELDPPLNAPTALAYGPGNTLYIFDNNMIIVYMVQH
jgi:hypothetical protein